MQKKKMGILIESRRVDLFLKQEDLAEMTGITTKTIYLIESGKGNPSFDTLTRIMEILGLEITIAIKKIIE